MPIGINSPARNLFLLGSSGSQIVTNFFKTIEDLTSDRVFIPDEIKYNSTDEKYLLAGSADDSNNKGFGWLEKRDQEGTADWNVKVTATTSVNTTLRAMELDVNDNLVVVGKTGDIPWIAKYSNGGVIDWQSTTNTADVEYTDVTSDSNGNYYACGDTSKLPDNIDFQAFVEKFDANGNPGWGKSAFMVGRDVELNSIAANNRGEVVAVGYLEDDSSQKGYIVKIDTNTGEVLWDRTLRTYRKYEFFNSYLQVECEGVYIDNKDQIFVVGTLLSPDPNESSSFLVKYSPEGNIIWQTETDIGDRIEYYQVKSDNQTEEVVVFGRYRDVANNNQGGIITKYSKRGEIIWRRSIISSFNGSNYFGKENGGDGGWVNLDTDSSFVYILYTDELRNNLFPQRYTYGKLSITGNGLGNFEYTEGTGETIDYVFLNTQDTIGTLSDGSVRNDTSDLVTYPFNANKLLFDDLATQVSNKKRQMDSAGSFEYSGSPAIRPADFQELNLLGDVYSGSGNWLDQSGKGNDGVVNGATRSDAGYWEFDGVNDYISLGTKSFITTEHSVEMWVNISAAKEHYFFSFGYFDDVSALLYADVTTQELQALWRVGGANQPTITTGELLATNQWYHILWTRDGATNKIYLDGVEVGSSTSETTVSLPACIYDIGWATTRDKATAYTQGNIGEVRIYPRALTPAQVFQNYNATKSKYINEAPDTAPKIGPGIVYGSNLLLNYDFGNRATYDRAENLHPSQGSEIGILSPERTTGRQYFMNWSASSYTSRRQRPIFSYSLSAGTHTLSFYVKPVGQLADANYTVGSSMSSIGNTYALGVQFIGLTGDLANSTNGGNIITPMVIENAGDGWYRVKITADYTGSGTGFFYWYPSSSSTTDLDTDTGFYVWGVQLERNSIAGRLIKTYEGAITAPTTVKNLSSSSYTGTINGATFNSAGYFEFDGTTGQIDLDTSVQFNTGDFSLCAWFKANSNPTNTGNRMIFGSGYAGSNPDVEFDINGNGTARLYVRDANLGTSQVASPLTYEDDTWHHVVGVKTSSGCELYVDGISVNSNTDGLTGDVDTAGANSIIGNGTTGINNRWFDGSIGEFQAYTKALTATEVSQNFNATRAKYGV